MSVKFWRWVVCVMILTVFTVPFFSGAQSPASGLDVVVLLENRDDGSFRDQDFGSLDPEGSRYDAIRFLAELLAEDSLSFNPDNAHWLSVIRFDAALDTGSDNEGVLLDGLAIDADTSGELEEILNVVATELRTPANEAACVQQARRCGANFSLAFQVAEDLLASRRSAQRDQLIIVLTADGCAGEGACLDSTHGPQMRNVEASVSRMAEAGVELYTYAIYGTEEEELPGELFQRTRNRLWSLVSSDEWENNIHTRIAGEVDILPAASDYLIEMRDILFDKLDFVGSGNVVENITPAPTNTLSILPYAGEFQLFYFKENSADRLDISYNNPNDNLYSPDIARRSSNFVETITVRNPAPGNFWNVDVAAGRGALLLFQLPSTANLSLRQQASNQTVSSISQYHEFVIEYVPQGSGNTPLVYNTRSFDLAPVAEVTNMATGSSWRVPLRLQQVEGAYIGEFYPVETGNHEVAITQSNAINTTLLAPAPLRSFAARAITYALAPLGPANPTQFEPWSYEVVFQDSSGARVSAEEFARQPALSVSSRFGATSIPSTPPLTYVPQTGVFEATQTFANHGEHSLTISAEIDDVNGDEVAITSETASDDFTVNVQSAPTSLDLSTTDALEYENVSLSVAVDNIAAQELISTYNVQFEAILSRTAEDETISERIPLAYDGISQFSGDYYAVHEGSYTVTVEGYRMRGTQRDVLVTQEQASASLNINPVTFGLITAPSADQFIAYDFTVELLNQGNSITVPLVPDVVQDLTVSFGDVEIPFASLTPTGQANQWGGTITFTDFGPRPVNIDGLARPPEVPGASADLVPIASAHDADFNVTVRATDVAFSKSVLEQRMLTPIDFSLDVPDIGNDTLRDTYGLTVSFSLAVQDANDETVTWTVPAQPVNDPAAPFSAQFVPPLAGAYTITPRYNIQGTSPFDLNIPADDLQFNVRPITVSFMPDPSPDWALNDAGILELEVNRRLNLTSSFLVRSSQSDTADILTDPPELPITVQAEIIPPGEDSGQRLTFMPSETDNTSTLQTDPFTTPGRYTIRLISEVVDEFGRSHPVGLDEQLVDGFAFDVITVGEIVMRVRDGVALDQFATGALPLQTNTVVIDVETGLRTSDSDFVPVPPASLFRNSADVDNSDWFDVTLNDEAPENLLVTFPQELENAFRLQFTNLSPEPYQLKVAINDDLLDVAFGRRIVQNPPLDGVQLDLQQNPLQFIIPGVVAALLLLIFIVVTVRRRAYQSRYAIPGGILMLEDAFGRVLWQYNLADGRQATQVFEQTSANVSGFGRALIDSITASATPKLLKSQQVQIQVKQENKPQTFLMSITGSSERQQLTGAQGAFYIRIKAEKDGSNASR